MSIDEVFTAAVEIVQNLPKDGFVQTSNDDKLEFYSFFKQATIGKCNSPKPPFWNVVEKYKWDAWNKLGDMSMVEAKQTYVDKLRSHIDQASQSHDMPNSFDPELSDRMLPLFTIIGRPFGREGVATTSDTEQPQPIPPTSSKTEIVHSEEVLSDAEYCDAVEDEDDHHRSRSSSYEIHSPPKTKRELSLTAYYLKVETQLKSISSQIEKLAGIIEKRNSMVVVLLEEAKAYLFTQKKRRFNISWKMIIFFFLWPFAANFLIRYVRRRTIGK